MKFPSSILLFLLSIQGFSQSDSMRFKMLENGILHKLDVAGIYFTGDGKTWFGTSEGLASFDGNDFRIYPPDQGSKQNINPERILAFAEDKDGFIWTFSSSRILTKFNPKTSGYEKIDFLKEHPSLQNKIFASALFFDKHNKLWIGSADYGFLIYDPATGKSKHHNLDNTKQGVWKSQYGNSVRHFLEDPYKRNIIWIASYGLGLLQYDIQTKTITRNFRTANVKDSLWRNSCITHMAIKDSTIWFGTWGMGMGEYNTRTGEYKMYPKNTGFYTERIGNDIYTHGHIISQIKRKSDTEYLISLIDSLPAIFNTITKKFTYISDPQLLRTINRTEAVGIDRFNNTWVLKGGKLYISSPRYNLFNSIRIDFESPGFVRDVLWNDKDKIYYAAIEWGKGIYVFDEKFVVKNIIAMPPYSGNGIVNSTSIWRVKKDKTNRLWAMGHIFCVYDSLMKQMVPVEQKYPAIKAFKKSFKDFTTDANGNLILMSWDREMIFLNVTTFEAHIIALPKILSEKIIDFNVSSILVDTPRNLVYVCDGRAIFQYNINNNRFKIIEYKSEGTNGLPATNVSSYALDFDGNLWVGTNGIYIFEPQNLKLIKQITAKDNLTDNVDINLVQGPPGYMFYFTAKGGNLYSLNDSFYVHFDLINGMVSDNPRSLSYANNHIFFTIPIVKKNQYAHIKSLLTLQKQIIPYVSDIKIVNKKLRLDTIPEFLTKLQLPHDQNSLTLTFSSVEFEFPERVEYSYKLDGLEELWTATDYMNRSVTYTNLSPGDYTFRVRARMLGGKWTEQRVPLIISIVPAFWQTWWFILLCIVLIGAIIYYLVWQRIQNIRKKENLRSLHEKEMIELEAKALRAQMNPHFIFNCLNSIKALIQKNENDTAANYLTTFSKLIRTLFQHSDKREVSLYEEIETCKLYTQLEALRFKDKVSFRFDVDDRIDLKDITVPALILQPFIENAIWHGLVPKDAGGHVSICIKQTEDEIQCIVDDDGIGRDLSKLYKAQYNSDHQSKGIALTISRLNIDRVLNERDEAIEILDKRDANGNSSGTTAILTLKK